MQLDRRGLLIRQPLEIAFNHVLSVPIRQLGTGLDDAPARPLGQDLAFWRHVPCHRECQPFHPWQQHKVRSGLHRTN